MMHSNTAAIVVTYNRLAMLKQCVSNLLASEEALDILIINNASTDGTEDYLRLLSRGNVRVRFRTNKKNIGGAGGFSQGTEWGVKEGYDFLWLMDDDSYVAPDALPALLKAHRMLEGNYGFLSSVVRWTDGTLCLMNRPHISLRKRVEEPLKRLTPIIMASFVGFFVQATTVQDVGLPVKEFFIWADDLEYSRRISRMKSCYLVSESVVTHAMQSNLKVGIETEAPERLWRYRFLYRNEVYLYRREGVAGIIFLFARIFAHSLRVIVSSEASKKEKLETIWRSFIDGWRFHPERTYEEE